MTFITVANGEPEPYCRTCLWPKSYHAKIGQVLKGKHQFIPLDSREELTAALHLEAVRLASRNQETKA